MDDIASGYEVDISVVRACYFYDTKKATGMT